MVDDNIGPIQKKRAQCAPRQAVWPPLGYNSDLGARISRPCFRAATNRLAVKQAITRGRPYGGCSGASKQMRGQPELNSRKALLASAIAGLLTAGSLGAQISGTVHFDGDPPAPGMLKLNADPKCVEFHGKEKIPNADVVVDAGGGLLNVFLYLKDPPAGDHAAPDEVVRLNQKGCMYMPRVQGILVDQTLEVVNSDDTLHNVRALARTNRPFNLGQPPATAPRIKTFKVAEPALKFKCDVHPWMASYMFVMDHPFFAVSTAAGAFRIDNVPAGTHTLVAWHERFGEQEIVVTAGAGGATDIGIIFTAE